MFQYVHHVHYLVRSRDAMIDYLEKTFGMKPHHILVNPVSHGRDALYDIGKTQIQITEPLDPASAMARQLATHGPGVWHVAWAVDNIRDVARELAAKGNKMGGKNGISESSAGYLTCNIDPASSHGLWFQLAGPE